MALSSKQLFAKAQSLFPGGVNSPVRAFKSVKSTPPFINSGKGSLIKDVEGNSYVDYVLSWGPLLLGHAHPKVVEAVCKTAAKGLSFGAPTPLENELAEAVQEFYPSIQKMRFVNSGTEACLSAIRVARAAAGRDKILKFSGCYHGHADYLLVSAGSGVSTLGLPDSPGVPADFTRHTLVAPYNDLSAVEKIFAEFKGQVAAVIVEPVVGNMGFVPPQSGFLKGLREVCTRESAVLIFDEVMTGFRVAEGGAQALFGITPDMTCLGKVIGGGMPLGAYGGKREIMNLVAPQGPVYQAGTLSGNPVAVSAGLATLRVIKEEKSFERAAAFCSRLIKGLREILSEAGVPARADGLGTMFGLFFTDKTVRNYEDAKTSDLGHFVAYFHSMLRSGIYLAPSQFEAGFTSSAHREKDLEKTLDAARKAMKGL
jgi:glutamate-1-semialdehyde 2,1-aminomutase